MSSLLPSLTPGIPASLLPPSILFSGAAATSCPCVAGATSCAVAPIYADNTSPRVQFNPATDAGFSSCACGQGTCLDTNPPLNCVEGGCDACDGALAQFDQAQTHCQEVAQNNGLDPTTACPIDYSLVCNEPQPYTPCPDGTVGEHYCVIDPLAEGEVCFEVCVPFVPPPPPPVCNCPPGDYVGTNPNTDNGCEPGDQQDPNCGDPCGYPCELNCCQGCKPPSQRDPDTGDCYCPCDRNRVNV